MVTLWSHYEISNSVSKIQIYFQGFNIVLFKVELNGHVKCFQILEKKIKNSSNLVLVESQEEHLSDNMVIAPRLY